LLVLVASFATVTANALCFFVVTVSKSPGGTVEFAGITRSLTIGDSAFVVPVFVKVDSDFAVTCNGLVKRDGYITPRLSILVYVDIRGCDIDAYKPVL
jgi:ABC-type phosphate transport system substrate-binding protein